MAKRKRLTSARADFLTDPGPAATTFAAAPIAGIAGDAASSAAAEELARTLSGARASGRLVVELPLEAVDASYLVRDRVAVDEEEMGALMASLSARGQQTPVDVVDLGGNRYGLISGWRRVEALRRLAEGNGGARVLALLRTPVESADAYLAMVEENEIRVGLSYYERARIALKAVEQGVFPDLQAALRSLFHAASRAKRSKIGSFVRVVEALDGHLACPADLGERTGLQLARAIETDPGFAPRLIDRLRGLPKGAQPEQDMIAAALEERPVPTGQSKSPTPKPRSRKVGPGLRCMENLNGSMVLSGPALDDRLRADLLGWLETRLLD
jgi:ParB family transcriptional regulator, chromosome partitioning protein